MAGMEKESYQTRTVDPHAYLSSEEKAGPPDDAHAYPTANGIHENDPTVAVPQNHDLIDGASPAKYGMPGEYNQQGYMPPGASSNGGYQSGAPPIMPSEVDVLAPASSKKGYCDTYILGIGLGFFGAHHFYLRRHGFGVAYLLTFGFLGCGYVADLFRIPCLVRRYNKTIAKGKVDNKKRLDDAYVCWFPLGLFGAHHFYLGRTGWGILYLFTVGLFGLGWLIDAFYLPHLVKKANEKRAAEVFLEPERKSYLTTHLLALFPFSGLLGIHHYYVGNYIFGLFYTLTLGNLGVGYIVDWFRVPLIVKRARAPSRNMIGHERKALLDEAYLMAFPLGFIGLHNFYLRRYGWGVLYLFTVGCFGIGWLIDLMRLPCMVRQYNKTLEETVGANASHSSAAGIVNPQMLQDPVGEQQKAMDQAAVVDVSDAGPAGIGGYQAGAGMPQGAIFATNLQPGYPYPPNVIAVAPYGPPNAYMPPTAGFYSPDPGMQQPGIPNYPPQYGDPDGLPSYNDAMSTGTIDSSLVSSQGGPPSVLP